MTTSKKVFLAHREFVVDNKLFTLQEFNEEYSQPTYDRMYEGVVRDFNTNGNLAKTISTITIQDGANRECLIYIEKKLKEDV